MRNAQGVPRWGGVGGSKKVRGVWVCRAWVPLGRALRRVVGRPTFAEASLAVRTTPIHQTNHMLHGARMHAACVVVLPSTTADPRPGTVAGPIPPSPPPHPHTCWWSVAAVGRECQGTLHIHTALYATYGKVAQEDLAMHYYACMHSELCIHAHGLSAYAQRQHQGKAGAPPHATRGSPSRQVPGPGPGLWMRHAGQSQHACTMRTSASIMGADCRPGELLQPPVRRPCRAAQGMRHRLTLMHSKHQLAAAWVHHATLNHHHICK